MALRVLTNEKDKEGRLIEQLIVSDVEENYFRDLAEDTFRKCLDKEYELNGLPEKVKGRQEVFRFLVALQKFWIYALGAAAGGITVLSQNIRIEFQNAK